VTIGRSVDQSSCETDSDSASQETVIFFHKNLPLDTILKQINTVHILTHYFFKIYFNIIVLFTSHYPKK
jgi:hypothetical protein